jgi:hypothetical protein
MTTEIQKLRARISRADPNTQYLRMTLEEAIDLEKEISFLEKQLVAQPSRQDPPARQIIPPAVRNIDGGTF